MSFTEAIQARATTAADFITEKAQAVKETVAHKAQSIRDSEPRIWLGRKINAAKGVLKSSAERIGDAAKKSWPYIKATWSVVKAAVLFGASTLLLTMSCIMIVGGTATLNPVLIGAGGGALFLAYLTAQVCARASMEACDRISNIS